MQNSMLKDGHMSTRALSHWVNGAAFHTQMLIHHAGLDEGDWARDTAAVDLYQQDLSLYWLTTTGRMWLNLCLGSFPGMTLLITNVTFGLVGPKQYFFEC